MSADGEYINKQSGRGYNQPRNLIKKTKIKGVEGDMEKTANYRG